MSSKMSRMTGAFRPIYWDFWGPARVLALAAACRLPTRITIGIDDHGSGNAD
jgi:hypothetical protein